MFKKKIIFSLNNFLSKFNIKIINLTSNEPYNLTNIDVNPLTAQYFAGHKKILMNVDLSKCRTNRLFDMSEKTSDPAIFAIKKSLEQNLKNEELYANILNILNENNFLGLAKNAAEYLNIEYDLGDKISNFPWWAAVNPWDNRNFEDQLKYYPIEVKKNRAKNGMRILSDDPYEIVRDDIENSLPSHTQQYVKLIKLIKKNGFKYGNEFGYVAVELFINNNKYCWKIGDEGNHRSVVAAALGFKKIPAIITKIIRLDEIDYWPNVINGLFSKEQANKVFYDIFEAKPSKFYQRWIEKNNK